jgi:NAD(P)-dependent dehydrogenase (short-subunit alcohol dehydrogenase family)
MRGLQGKIAAVTGAGRGIGAAIAKRLAQEGVAVVVTDVDADLAEGVSREIVAAGGRSTNIAVDVLAASQLAVLPEVAREAFGAGLDIVISNAGIQTFAAVTDLSQEDWARVIDVNARGTFLTLQMAARALTGRPSAIVTIASIQGRLPGPMSCHYNASKAAVLSLTKSFAKALAGEGVRVNAVAPGIVETSLWDFLDAEMARIRGISPGEPRRRRVASVPLGRACTPEEVAAAAAFLASEDASYITGECLHVCGGDVML